MNAGLGLDFATEHATTESTTARVKEYSHIVTRYLHLLLVKFRRSAISDPYVKPAWMPVLGEAKESRIEPDPKTIKSSTYTLYMSNIANASIWKRSLRSPYLSQRSWSASRCSDSRFSNPYLSLRLGGGGAPYGISTDPALKLPLRSRRPDGALRRPLHSAPRADAPTAMGRGQFYRSFYTSSRSNLRGEGIVAMQLLHLGQNGSLVNAGKGTKAKEYASSCTARSWSRIHMDAALHECHIVQHDSNTQGP